MKRFLGTLLVLFFSLQTFAAKIVDDSGYAFDPNDTSCDGYPTLQVETVPGTCLGMVISQASQKKTGHAFSMPRMILPLPNSKDFLVTDMGSWNADTGFLFWLHNNGKNYDIVTVKSKLNLPHGLRLSKDGYIYLGENQRIRRFHFINGQIRDEQLVVGNLPANKGDLHPMTQFTFNPANNDLYINSGAPTDHCAKSAGQPCKELDSQDAGASIMRIPGNLLVNIPPSGVNPR